MCVASFLIWNAKFMGKKFEEYTESGFVVGELSHEDDLGDNDNAKGGDEYIEMASQQNEDEDTSCAFHDDDEIGPEDEGQSQDGGEETAVKSPSEKHVVELV